MKASEAYGFFKAIRDMIETGTGIPLGQAHTDLGSFARLFGVDLSEVMEVVSESVRSYESAGETSLRSHPHCTKYNVLEPFNRHGSVRVNEDHLDGLQLLTLHHARKTEEEPAINQASLRFDAMYLKLLADKPKS
jgi:hypothetical protein